MRSASSESESNRHSTIDCQSALGLNKRWHFSLLLFVKAHLVYSKVEKYVDSCLSKQPRRW